MLKDKQCQELVSLSSWLFWNYILC